MKNGFNFFEYLVISLIPVVIGLFLDYDLFTIYTVSVTLMLLILILNNLFKIRKILEKKK